MPQIPCFQSLSNQLIESNGHDGFCYESTVESGHRHIFCYPRQIRRCEHVVNSSRTDQFQLNLINVYGHPTRENQPPTIFSFLPPVTTSQIQLAFIMLRLCLPSCVSYNNNEKTLLQLRLEITNRSNEELLHDS